MYIPLALLVLSTTLMAQELPTTVVKLEPITNVEELKKRGIPESEINKAIAASKKDIIEMVGEKEFLKYKPIGVDIDEAKITKQTPFLCEEDQSEFTKNTEAILKSLQEQNSEGHGGMIYVTWGYNRSWFSDTDTTFKTPDGTFTIHGAKGVDRPTTEFKTYINPAKLTIPQYNFRIGYRFNKRWAVELGTDHMKWIFVPTENYDITGDYNRPVWLHDEDANHNWLNTRQVTFEEAKAQKNATFLKMEHSDGYNYPHASVFFTETLLKTKNERFRLDGSIGGGVGILVPKTRVQIHDQETLRDVDNKFHVAGWGAHLEANAKVVYAAKSGREVFLQASNRGHVGKINNALFLGNESGSISQAPIYTYLVYVSVGVAQPIGGKKKKK